MDRTSAILACGVALFLCGAICTPTRQILEEHRITVYPWITGSVDVVLEALQTNTLESLLMPGCRRKFDHAPPSSQSSRRGNGDAICWPQFPPAGSAI